MEQLNIYELPKEILLIENASLVMHDMSTVYRLCTQRYNKHSKGCPNFNSKIGCPPEAQHISQQYDLSCIHLLLLRFPFYQYISAKQQTHPDWSMGELTNQRHWQNHLKATLNQHWETIKQQYPDYNVIRNPEGQGVNISETLKQYDIDIQWCERDQDDEISQVPEYMYHVYLLGKELDKQ